MSEHEGDSHKGIGSTPLTRREVLKGALVVGAGAALGPAIAAASASASSASQQGHAGRHLKIGIGGGSANETLDGQMATTEPEICATSSSTMRCSAGIELQARPAAGRGLVPNADATVWKVKLRAGVVFHNGKPLTADDVIYQLQAHHQSKEAEDGRHPASPL